jgi:hypothetical protein
MDLTGFHWIKWDIGSGRFFHWMDLLGFSRDLDSSWFFFGFGFTSFVLNCTIKLRLRYTQTKYYGIKYCKFGDEH